MKKLILIALAASLLSGCAGSEWDLSNKCEAGNQSACQRLDNVRYNSAMVAAASWQQYQAQQAQAPVQQPDQNQALIMQLQQMQMQQNMQHSQDNLTQFMRDARNNY